MVRYFVTWAVFVVTVDIVSSRVLYGYAKVPIAPKYECKFANGSAFDGPNIKIGDQTGQGCVDACVKEKKSDGSINGIIVPSNGMGGCWCVMDMENVASSTEYKTCFLKRVQGKKPPLYNCLFIRGDGGGGVESKIGDQTGPECINACVDEKRKDDSINGVKVRSNGEEGCWCERNIKLVSASSKYNTCFLIPQDVVHKNYDCIFASGDGDGGSEIQIGNFKGQDCVNACLFLKKNDNSINGVTESGDECWCEKGMTSVIPSSTYKTCRFTHTLRGGSQRRAKVQRLPSYTCKFANGTVDGPDIKVGDQVGQGCVDACVDAKRNDASINGVRIQSNGMGGCWCALDMESIAGSSEYQTCFLVPARKGSQKVDGEWSSWTSVWTKCSRSCGQQFSGEQFKTRQCDNPPPSNGGRSCHGSRVKAQICKGADCRVDSITTTAAPTTPRTVNLTGTWKARWIHAGDTAVYIISADDKFIIKSCSWHCRMAISSAFIHASDNKFLPSSEGWKMTFHIQDPTTWFYLRMMADGDLKILWFCDTCTEEYNGAPKYWGDGGEAIATRAKT